MSYFDDASLVMIPSGYKTSKVYSVKPTDGSGDLTFSRSNDTATRVNSAGLIEKVRTNLATYSNDFSNASWAKVTDGTYSLVTESITDAFGNTSAVYKFTLLTGSFFVFRKYLASATTQTTNFSLYVKKTNSSSYVAIDIDDNADVAAANNTNWQRISNTRATASFVDITTYSINEPFYVFASQIELGDVATSYIATTSAAVSVGPVANVPRLDYLNSSCSRLLLDPQRTNLVLYSEQFDNAAWTKTSATITANSTVSPDGYTNADTIVGTASFGRVEQSVTYTAAAYTLSVFVKKATTSQIFAAAFSQAGEVDEFAVNINTGATTLQGANISSVSCQDYGAYWRVVATSTRTATTQTLRLFAGFPTNISPIVYGCQLEAGAYATSYIPTLGSASTRGSDACSKTGISSLIGQTEGTLFAEFNFDGRYDSNGIIPIVTRTSNNEAYVFISGAGSLLCEIVVGGVPQASISGSIGAVGLKKIAFAYKQNDFVVYLNGVQVGTDSSGTVGAMADLNVGSYHSSGYSTMNGINQALLFPTRLSNADLAALTA